ncbi:MAG: hypothetical protein ACJ8NS_03845 [Chthoniobacterales bacterium]
MRERPNFSYHFALWLGKALRSFYRSLLPLILLFKPTVRRSFPFEVFAYSSDAMLPEQVASIRSFLRYLGRPKSFTVVSDGSHSDRSVRLLKRVDRSVSVTTAKPTPAGLPTRLESYLNCHPTGKQLALIMSLPRHGPALYVDADVRFFPGASDLVARGETKDLSAYYLVDCQFAGDHRLLRSASEPTKPVNTGVLFLFRQLDWSLSIRRFLELEGEPTFFTNQTMTHLTMHENGASPFDPAKYVVQLDDQCVFADRHAGASLALRHYVNPVRHKFWTSILH